MCKVKFDHFYLSSPLPFPPLFLALLSPSQKDPTLEIHMRELVVSAAKSLDRARMIRFVEHTGNLHATDLGRTASHFYIKSASIEVGIFFFFSSSVLLRFSSSSASTLSSFYFFLH